MADTTNPAWVDLWSGQMAKAQEAADRPMIAVILDGGDEGDTIHTLALDATAGDAEAAALAILGDVLDHYASLPANQLCDSCRDRVARITDAIAALTDGDTAPRPMGDPGARLQ